MGNGGSAGIPVAPLSSRPHTTERVKDETNDKDEFLWKLVVVGDTGSGKTCIMNRLVSDIFTVRYQSTDQVNFFLKQLRWDSNTFFKTQIWDVAGSEKYGVRTRMFYQNSLGAVVVLDATKKDSLKEAEAWAVDIQSKVTLGEGTKYPIVVMANKVDLLSKAEKEKMKVKLEVLATRNSLAGWWMTSAKECYNIDRPFMCLLDKICKLSDCCPIILSKQVIPRDNEDVFESDEQLV